MSDSLTFRILEYVEVTAKTLNFTAAAKTVFVAQSCVSGQIKKLEQTIDVLIFERVRNRLELTPAGRIIVAYAQRALREWNETVAMARAVERHEVPALRLGFSSFVNAKLLERFHEHYERLFEGCGIQLLSGDPLLCLNRLNAGTLDCAILPLPIEANEYYVQQVARSPLVVCMRSDDSLADQPALDLREIADRITVFRDPELQPAAHARLVEMFQEAGIEVHFVCGARTPSEIQWMVKERYGLALVDQVSPLEPGLITRPIAGRDWTADTALIHLKTSSHVALPFVQQFFEELWTDIGTKKRPPASVRPEQMRLLA